MRKGTSGTATPTRNDVAPVPALAYTGFSNSPPATSDTGLAGFPIGDTMGTTLDMSGKTFGSLTVLAYNGYNSKHLAVWKCLCSCGNIVDVVGRYLRNGDTKSCGCLKSKSMRAVATTHGMRSHAAYGSFRAAKERCSNPQHKAYAAYGGRGIEFRFDGFEQFWALLGDTWFPKATIERIDVNGHYEPGNVRWVIASEQARNTRANHRISFGGRTALLVDWAKDLGICESTLLWRLRNWPLDRALTTRSTHEKTGV